jgi:hypothetical protein
MKDYVHKVKAKSKHAADSLQKLLGWKAVARRAEERRQEDMA